MIGATKFSRFVVNTLITQLIYLFSYLGIMFVIFMFVTFSDIYHGQQSEIYYSIVITILALAMFVIGFSTVSSIQDVVENGITRKDYFRGGLASGCIIAVLLPIMAFIISIVSEAILVNISDVQFKIVEQNNFNYGEIGTLFSLFTTEYIDPQIDLLLSLITASVNGFIFYLLGTLLGIIVYRSKSTFDGGFLFGVIDVIIFGTWNLLFGILLEPNVSNNSSFLANVPKFLIIIALAALLLLTIYLLRLLTKNIVIKI